MQVRIQINSRYFSENIFRLEFLLTQIDFSNATNDSLSDLYNVILSKSNDSAYDSRHCATEYGIE